MAKKSNDQLETELAEALATIEALKAENASLKAANTRGVDAPISADEADIRRRVRAGLSRKDAEEAHERQKIHDANIIADKA